MGDGDEIETYIERFKKRLVHPTQAKSKTGWRFCA